MASQYVNSLKIGNYTYSVGDVIKVSTNYLSDYSYQLKYTYSGEYVRTNTWQIYKIVNPEYYTVGSKYYPIYPLQVKAYTGDMSAGAGFVGDGMIVLGSGGTPDTYTISFNANGGSGAPSAQTKSHNVAITLSSAIPARSGYTFLGWSTSSTATSASYSAGGSYTANGNATLYAVWKTNTYTISYNANGGSGAPGSQIKTHGVNLVLSSVKPTRTGYTFLGWSTNSAATTVMYTSGGQFAPNGNATLYAVWSENYLTVNYYSNGADYCEYCGTVIEVSEDTNVLVATHQLYYDDSQTNGLFDVQNPDWLFLLKSNYDPTGYWGTETDGGTLVHEHTQFVTGQAVAEAFGLSLVNGNKSVDVYAQWELAEFDINYGDGEGSGTSPGTGFPQVGSGTVGQDTIISTTHPTKHGYTFLGWSTIPNSTVVEYLPGDILSGATSNITLYAVWMPWQHDVVYSLNGGNDNEGLESFTKTTDDGCLISTVIPTKLNGNFICWNTEADGSGTKYNAGAPYSYTQDGGTVTLYAIWASSAIAIYDNGNMEAVKFIEIDLNQNIINTSNIVGEAIVGQAIVE